MSRSPRRGFSLIELLVVLAIIAILIGLLLPATRRVREASTRMKCLNNIKQVTLAFHNYESATGRLPPGCIGPETTPENRLSWMVALLPQVEQENLARQISPHLDKGYEGNLPTLQTSIGMFVCPEVNDTAAVTHYIAMSGIGREAATQPADVAGNGFMGYDRHTSLAAIAKKDGTGNTIALMETRFDLGPWARGGPSTLRGFDPADVPFFGDGRPFGGHSNGMNAAMADGSVRFIRSSLDPTQLAAAVTIAGGEPVDLN